jgi:hypothetical protein
MQTPILKFSKRFGVATLTVAGFIAAATAHADPGKNSNVSPPPVLRDPPQQCSDVDAILTRLQFPTGTTFMLTDAGLVVLNQPSKAVRYPEPEPWPNTGN